VLTHSSFIEDDYSAILSYLKVDPRKKCCSCSSSHLISATEADKGKAEDTGLDELQVSVDETLGGT